MNTFIEELFGFFTFWDTIGLEKFIRFFWYFFLFELMRYVILDYLVVFYAHFRRWKDKEKYAKARQLFFSENPLISIIAPGKNEGKNIPSLVKSLYEQTYKNIEIIIVDDGSDDDSAVICRKLLKQGVIHKFFRNDVRGGKASAANLALSLSQGKFAVHVDADCSFDRDAIEKVIIPFYMDANIGAVAGNVIARNDEESLCTRLQAIEYLKSIKVGRQVSGTMGVLRIVSGAFGAFRRDILDRVGGWDVGPGLDGDITYKIRKLHYRIYFESQAVCMTSVPVAFKTLAKQRFRWDKSLIRFRLRRHKDVFVPNANFSWKNLFASVENIFFNLVLDLKWIIYIIDMLLHFPGYVKFILPANYLLYMCSSFLQFLIAISDSKNKSRDIKLLLYIPIIPLYVGIFLRFIRTYAYFRELFFKDSYKDPWNPKKVSDRVLANT